jgi:hypothetical protein
MLVSLRIAKIRQHAVPHVLGDETAVALDQFVAAAMIGGNDLPQLLWVEPGRHRSRPHEIAEHDRQLAALGVLMPSSLGRHRCRSYRDGN